MTQPCPRQTYEATMRVQLEHRSHWREDGTCSYCGSLNPATLMGRLETGDVLLGATDKNYKLYVENDGGVPFKQTYRDCPRDSTCSGPTDCAHWVTREVNQTKFYFQHFNEAQMRRFIELYNASKLRFRDYGKDPDTGEWGPHVVARGFYRLPFFMRPLETNP